MNDSRGDDVIRFGLLTFRLTAMAFMIVGLHMELGCWYLTIFCCMVVIMMELRALGAWQFKQFVYHVIDSHLKPLLDEASHDRRGNGPSA